MALHGGPCHHQSGLLQGFQGNNSSRSTWEPVRTVARPFSPPSVGWGPYSPQTSVVEV